MGGNLGFTRQSYELPAVGGKSLPATGERLSQACPEGKSGEYVLFDRPRRDRILTTTPTSPPPHRVSHSEAYLHGCGTLKLHFRAWILIH
jgi:hypothetical protein